jgi:hypothetical protein
VQGAGAARGNALPLVPGPRRQEREERAGGRSHLGVSQWPPMVILEVGSRARLQVTTVEARFQARGLALFGDRLAEAARAYSPAGGPLKAYVKAAGAECRRRRGVLS